MRDNGFIVKLPDDIDEISQDEEYCFVSNNGDKKKIRFHDYHEIYKIPGLYEHIFYDRLKCISHKVVTTSLMEELENSQDTVNDLSVIELGAGNGLVGEALKEKGVDSIIGVDIIEEAKDAVNRDRPDVYNKYYIKDFCNLTEHSRNEFESENLNCLVCVAALGFSDIPPYAFANAFNLISDGGWIAFNIKADFIKDSDSTGFSKLINYIIEKGQLEVTTKHNYCHRLSVNGKPLEYVAIIGKKHANIPLDMV